MAYGIIKVDTVTFTDAGIDKSVSLSGLVQNPTFSGNVTVTGTLSGVTVTGTTASFTSGVFTSISGATVVLTSGVFASGTAAAPSVSVGTTSNGIYSPGTNQLALSTNGTGRLFVDAVGNISVKTATAQATLDISKGLAAVTAAPNSVAAELALRGDSSAGLTILSTNTGQCNVFFGDPDNVTTGRIQYLHDVDAMRFNVNASERLRITSAGLVGIGTSSPGSLLSLGTSTANQKLLVYDDTANKTLYGFGMGSGEMRSFAASNGVLTFGQISTTDGTTYTERARIDSSGRVGIGTTSPSVAFEVRTTSTTAHTVAAFGSGSQPAALQVTTDGNLDWGFNALNSRNLTFSTNQLERARIDSSGRLLVGTSSQSGGALLQVNGDRVRIATAKTPASASDTGTTGEVCWDASYIYVCTATNTWKRAALSTW